MKKISLYILISILLTNILSCTKNETIDLPKKSTVSQYYKNNQNGEDYIEIANKLKSLISTENNMEYDCVNQEKYIYFTVWRDGIAAQAINAKNGDVSSIEYWNKNVENYKQTALELYDYAIQLGLKSKPFRFAVLNERNKNNVLVIIENNKILYDYVNN